MQQWYKDTTKTQKTLMYVVCVPLIFVYGVGILPLIFLLYCEAGNGKYK